MASYGQVALLCGNPRASRAVGWALRRNPAPGRRSPATGREPRRAARARLRVRRPDAQRSLLEAEGVAVDDEGFVDMERYAWYGPTEPPGR